MTGLLLEGIVASGKTSVIRAIQALPAWQRRSSKLLLSEFFTERANEHLRNRDADAYRALMHKNLRILDAARQIEMASPLLSEESGRELCYLLERFHFTNAISYADGLLETYRDIDLTLARLNCRVVVLLVEESMVSSRVAEVFRQRGQAWQAYQKRLEEKVGDLGTHYVGVQRAFVSGLKWTSMEHRTIDATDKDWRRCAEEILEFWRI
ncbi:MAG TPA: hypothetical protein PLE60_02120 [Candidatus Latescibacteria bacterium]|nr:hypothetical protein [Candidatus Latescibacterota bacterium]